MNTVLIPVFRRPEFLQAALRNIEQADNAPLYTYIFRLDHGYDRDNLPIINSFPFRKELRYTPRSTYGPTKQSFSLLTGLTECAAKSDLVFLIEDDVIIGRDFFRWHEHAHRDELFSSHANLNINSNPIEGQWDQLYYTTGDYSSIGTCLTAKSIRSLGKHINREYLRYPEKYIDKTFPDSGLNKSQAEQDGLIRRVQMGSGLPIAYPCHQYIDGLLYGPRCYHAGFVGKNRRRKSLIGTLQQRIERVNATIYSTDMMKHECADYWYDSIPCALDLPQWKTLQRIPSPKWTA